MSARGGTAPAGRPGVGLLYNPALIDFLDGPDTGLDHLAVIPDRAWLDHGAGRGRRFETLSEPMAIIERTAARWPLAPHAIGLSICSADVFDRGYLAQLARWRERFGCPWVSEHLSFSRFGGEHEANAATALAPPFDQELLDLLVPRVREARATLGVPFLLENAVNYLDWGDADFSEPQFLNRLVAETGCGLLLDLHNLYTNAHNHGFDALAWLAALDLGAVQEIHVAGGDAMLGLHTDSHAGPVHAAVWPLLDAVLPRCPALRGVTFEFHEASWPTLKEAGLRRQIAAMHTSIERALARHALRLAEEGACHVDA